MADVGLVVIGCKTESVQGGRRVSPQCSGFDRKEVDLGLLPFQGSCAAASATIRRCAQVIKAKNQPPKPPAVRAQTFRVSCVVQVGASPPASGKCHKSASSISGRRSFETVVDESPPLPLGEHVTVGGTNPHQSVLKTNGN